MTTDKTFVSKLGNHGGGKRIWLEGKRLLAHGFERGVLVSRKWEPGKLTLRIVERDNDSKVAGTEERPIIDITGAKVSETFKGTHVSVTYRKGSITITEEA